MDIFLSLKIIFSGEERSDSCETLGPLPVTVSFHSSYITEEDRLCTRLLKAYPENHSRFVILSCWDGKSNQKHPNLGASLQVGLFPVL
jgi:hypothetical protein